MRHFTAKKTGGYSMVEIIVYAALMTLLVSVIAYAASVLFSVNTVVKATRRVENSAIAAGDKLIREIRAAETVLTLVHAFDVPDYNNHNDEITLLIPTESGNRTVRFYRSGERVMMDENGSTVGPLTLSDVRATSLHFVASSTPNSTMVTYELTLLGPASAPGVSEKFYGSAVLRGSYND